MPNPAQIRRSKPHEREWGAGTVKEVRPGVWRAWRARVRKTDGASSRPSRTFTGDQAEERAKLWAAGDVEPDVLLLGHWLDRWLALRAPTLRPATILNYRRFILACGGLVLRPLAELDTDDWQALVNELLGRWSRKHVVAWRGIISGALKAAVPRHLAYNPLAGVRLPKAVEEPPKAWRADEVAALLTAARGRSHEMWLAFSLGTGIRLGESRALTWADIDIQARTATIGKSLDNMTDELGPTKSGKIRIVDIPDELVPMLRSHRARQAPSRKLVFGKRDDRPCRAATYRRWLWRLCHQVKVADLSPHATRHTFVSLALDGGTPIQDIAQALGHASIATTQNVYSHFIGQGQRRGAKAVGKALGRALGGPKSANGSRNGTRQAG